MISVSSSSSLSCQFIDLILVLSFLILFGDLNWQKLLQNVLKEFNWSTPSINSQKSTCNSVNKLQTRSLSHHGQSPHSFRIKGLRYWYRGTERALVWPVFIVGFIARAFPQKIFSFNRSERFVPEVIQFQAITYPLNVFAVLPALLLLRLGLCRLKGKNISITPPSPPCWDRTKAMSQRRITIRFYSCRRISSI